MSAGHQQVVLDGDAFGALSFLALVGVVSLAYWFCKCLRNDDADVDADRTGRLGNKAATFDSTPAHRVALRGGFQVVMSERGILEREGLIERLDGLDCEALRLWVVMMSDRGIVECEPVVERLDGLDCEALRLSIGLLVRDVMPMAVVAEILRGYEDEKVSRP